MNLTQETAFRTAIVKTIKVCRNGSVQQILDHAREMEAFLKENRPDRIKLTMIKVRDFFTANPDEELTIGDVQDKYGCSLAVAKDALQGLCTAGLLKIRVQKKIRIFSLAPTHQ